MCPAGDTKLVSQRAMDQTFLLSANIGVVFFCLVFFVLTGGVGGNVRSDFMMTFRKLVVAVAILFDAVGSSCCCCCYCWLLLSS